MLINAIITAKEKGMTTTFGASIVPPHKGDIIIRDHKEYVVVSVKQELCGSNVWLHVEMEHKEDLACQFK